ncbi:putative lipid-binding transport protein (Tim44 family) [Paucibacter oligotrophus]|uniref:Putative lipid-binding transport protein (Tim44 family) n=2 Tax=Roseateles oligotrophus TaxID=1769250 RepID=A0A840L5R4_9BURK|nr:putative lipid-binding transport protein (Tim44 family) [Roseateles oligotrophus]
MKRMVLSALIAVCALGVASFDAHAKRLGGGGSSGMKRATPTQPHEASKGAPAQQAAPQQAAPAAPMATPPAAAPKRNWMGPLAGLAAGLGIAALFSHFGMGGALANIVTMLLIGFAAFMLIGFLMRRFAANKAKSQGMQFAGAGAPFPASGPAPAQPQPVAAPSTNLFNSLSPAAAAPLAAGNGPALPVNDGFDTAGFEQLAKRVFIRLQAANDAGDQNDLRRFTTPEMFGVVQQELLDRKGAAQRTDVLQLDAQIVERAQENGQQIVSVRFWGLIREQSEAAAENFDEVWHLVRPLDESREWAIAGIQARS